MVIGLSKKTMKTCSFQERISAIAEDHHNMTSVHVQFKGQTKEIELPSGHDTTWAQLQELLEVEFHVVKDAQRVFFNKKRVEFETDASATLQSLGWGSGATPMRIMLMAGATRDVIEGMKKTQEEVETELRIRSNRRVVSIDCRNEQIEAREAVATEYRFHAIEVLENFRDAHRARDILEQLANDRGILAVMAKHKWSVGCLAEMYPDGKVGVDPVCVLGLNQNKGQKILLRLRTDDLQGFRKFLNIKKVLFHELTHNVHSDHDSKFYQLMRVVERECDELDWSNNGGRAVGGPGRVATIADRDEDSSTGGQRLGGGGTAVSRLLRTSATTPEQRDVSGSPPRPSTHEAPAQSISTQQLAAPVEEASSVVIPIAETPLTDAIDTSLPEAMDVDLPETHTHATPPAALVQLPQTPLIDVSFGDYQPSERELRLQHALESLRARYSADVASSAASILHKMVYNIVQHPQDDKYRSIRKANRLFSTRIACFPESLEFLQAIGFEDQQESYTLTRNDPALLWFGRSLLDVLMEEQ